MSIGTEGEENVGGVGTVLGLGGDVLALEAF